MIFTIFCIVLFLIGVSFVISIEWGTSYPNILGNSAGVLVICIVIWLGGMFIGGLIMTDQAKESKKTYLKEPVYSLVVKNGSIKGSFFLGSGGFSSGSPKYLMFYEKDGGKQLLDVPAKYTVVYEDEEKTPYIIRKVFVEWDYSTAHKWFTHFGENGRWKEVDEYKLHVPKGTIRINPDEIDLSKLN